MGLLAEELAALYAAFGAGRPSPLPELPVSYADFARWQRSARSRAALDGEMAYWRGTLRDPPPPPALPTPLPPPPPPAARLGGRGARRPVLLHRALVTDLQALAHRGGATLFMVLTAGFGEVLARSSGQRDFCLGTPVAGRTREEVEKLIGCFVNTLVLRTPA